MTRQQKLLTALALVPLGMFLFGFALVPLYDVFCRVTGLNGKVNQQPLEQQVLQAQSIEDKAAVDEKREVRIQFLTQNNASMPWTFEALEPAGMRVKPGVDNRAIFRVVNTTDHFMTGQAVPSVSPSEAARYFHKVQCFCFNEQQLEAGESLDMTVIFVVDKDLPEHIHTITLGYTLFDITKVAVNHNH